MVRVASSPSYWLDVGTEAISVSVAMIMVKVTDERRLKCYPDINPLTARISCGMSKPQVKIQASHMIVYLIGREYMYVKKTRPTST